MEKYSLLETTYFTKDKLNTFKKVGSSATASDYAVVCGCILSANNKSLYLTKTHTNAGGVCCNQGFDTGMEYNCKSKIFGIRPCIYNYEVNDKEILYDTDDFCIIKKGYFPQKAYDKKESKILEKKYKNKELILTNLNYNNTQKNNQICFDGSDFFIRVVANPNCDYAVLSNNIKIKKDSVVYIKIEPLLWYYDKKSKILFTKDVIASGIPLDNNLFYKGDFDLTYLSIYLNEIFSKEINLKLYSKEYISFLKNELIKNKEVKIKKNKVLGLYLSV